MLALISSSDSTGSSLVTLALTQAEQAAGSQLNLLFRHAIETGKRARTETDIARGTASVSHAAVEMAAERLGDLSGRRVCRTRVVHMNDGENATMAPRCSWVSRGGFSSACEITVPAAALTCVVSAVSRDITSPECDTS